MAVSPIDVTGTLQGLAGAPLQVSQVAGGGSGFSIGALINLLSSVIAPEAPETPQQPRFPTPVPPSVGGSLDPGAVARLIALLQSTQKGPGRTLGQLIEGR